MPIKVCIEIESKPASGGANLGGYTVIEITIKLVKRMVMIDQ